jgi:hypothetical protein
MFLGLVYAFTAENAVFIKSKNAWNVTVKWGMKNTAQDWTLHYQYRNQAVWCGSNKPDCIWDVPVQVIAYLDWSFSRVFFFCPVPWPPLPQMLACSLFIIIVPSYMSVHNICRWHIISNLITNLKWRSLFWKKYLQIPCMGEIQKCVWDLVVKSFRDYTWSPRLNESQSFLCCKQNFTIGSINGETLNIFGAWWHKGSLISLPVCNI